MVVSLVAKSFGSGMSVVTQSQANTPRPRTSRAPRIAAAHSSTRCHLGLLPVGDPVLLAGVPFALVVIRSLSVGTQ